MTAENSWRVGANRDPNVRAGDADREAIATRLRDNHSEGRLDTHEFQERIDRCYQAKTIGELDELVTDLPRHSGESGQGVRSVLRSRRWRLAAFAPILIALLAINAIAGDHDHHAFSLVIPLFFFFTRFCFWHYRPWRPRRWDEPPIGERL